MPGGTLPARWQPMREIPREQLNPKAFELRDRLGLPHPASVWQNDRYEVDVTLVTSSTGAPDIMHLSIKARDRSPMRNWRHLQQIKNEIAGEDRWAMEVFPAEDHLVDTANQYHLFVMPDGMSLPWVFREGPLVTTDEQVEAINASAGKGKQEPWEPGLTTGRHGAEGNPILNVADAAQITPDQMAEYERGKDQAASGT